MEVETSTADSEGRVTLPKDFANAILLVERVSDAEVRIRKAEGIPDAGTHFREESPTVLSPRDTELFLHLLDDPAEPNEALKRISRHG